MSCAVCRGCQKLYISFRYMDIARNTAEIVNSTKGYGAATPLRRLCICRPISNATAVARTSTTTGIDFKNSLRSRGRTRAGAAAVRASVLGIV